MYPSHLTQVTAGAENTPYSSLAVGLHSGSDQQLVELRTGPSSRMLTSAKMSQCPAVIYAPLKLPRTVTHVRTRLDHIRPCTPHPPVPGSSCRVSSLGSKATRKCFCQWRRQIGAADTDIPPASKYETGLRKVCHNKGTSAFGHPILITLFHAMWAVWLESITS